MNTYNNQSPLANPATFLRTITIIHIALVLGLVLFSAVSFFINNSTVINLKPANDLFFYIVPSFAIASIAAGTFLFKQKMAKLIPESALKEKLSVYQTALITRYALTEGASLFAIVSYLNTGNLFYLVVAGINLVYFIGIRPTKSKMEDDLNLSYEDKIAMEG